MREVSDMTDVSQQHRRNIQKAIMVFCFLLLFFFSAFRWNVGVDTWFTYTPEYLAMKSESIPLTEEEEQIMLASSRLYARMTEGATIEQAQAKTLEEAYSFYRNTSKHTAIGFQAIEKILIFLNADVQWLYIITSAIILLFVFAAIRRQTDTPILALLMFILTGNFFLSLNILSQFMAISICLYACTFAQERKPVPFFLLVAVAACFHYSALIFIPVYFLPKLRIKPLWCAVITAAVLLAAQFCFPLLKKLISAVAPAYTRHFGDQVEFEWIFFAIGLAVFAVGTYYYPKGKDKPYYKLWYYANILGLIALCFSGHIPYMKRINFYFAAPHFLFLLLVIQCEEKPQWRRVMTVVMIALFVAETVVATGLLNKNGILPYQVFFQSSRTGMTDAMLVHIPGLW